jgi:hypothetical protein
LINKNKTKRKISKNMESVVYHQPSLHSAKWLLGGELIDIVSLEALSAQYGPVKTVKTSRDGTYVVRMARPHDTFVPIDNLKAAAAARRLHAKFKRKIALLAASGLVLATGGVVSLLNDNNYGRINSILRSHTVHR